MRSFVDALESYHSHRKYSHSDTYRDEYKAARLVDAFRQCRPVVSDAPIAVDAALDLLGSVPKIDGRASTHLERAITALTVDVADAIHDWAYPKPAADTTKEQADAPDA